MSKVAVVTDSNSGISQEQAKEYGIYVLPMPFYINEQLHFEDVDLTQDQFYEELKAKANISTSQPSAGDVIDLWDRLLLEYDEILHMPMSSGLSGSYETAAMLANEDYKDKVYVVNNQRISVTQRLAAYEAKKMADCGMSASDIKKVLEEKKFDSSIYISLETLEYLKRGGRITPAAAAFGTLLKIKPVLQIQGEKLDAFAKVRSLKSAKTTMTEAIKKDCITRFGADDSLDNIILMMAYTGDMEEINRFKEEINELYPKHNIIVNPLSLSVACHIGPGAIAIACARKIDGIDYSKL